MYTKNTQVAQSWIKGIAAKGSNFTTDGQNIYSYKKLIGYTDLDGKKHVIDNGYISRTTTAHVNKVKKAVGKK